MSAAAGAAGYRFRHRSSARKPGPPIIQKQEGDVRAFARMLQDRFGMSALRAWELAEEQAQKVFRREPAA